MASSLVMWEIIVCVEISSAIAKANEPECPPGQPSNHATHTQLMQHTPRAYKRRGHATHY